MIALDAGGDLFPSRSLTVYNLLILRWSNAKSRQKQVLHSVFVQGAMPE
jgi:hypothetical protein